MGDLVAELDKSMMRKGFGVDSSRCPTILYRRGGYDVSVTPDTHTKILGKSELESGSGRFVASKVDPSNGVGFGSYSGSTFRFSLKGKVREGASEKQYRGDMHALKSGLNEGFNGDNISIDTFVCMPFNGGQEINLSELRLYYKEGTPPKAIADAVGLVQEQVYKLLRQYIQ